MSSRFWPILFWACFVLRGAFYASSIPLWEGFDEYSHYARIEYLATHGHEPTRDTPLPEDVVKSFASVPVHGTSQSFDEFWKRPAAERQTGIPVSKETIYEAQQPPVFYWLCAGVYRMTGFLPLGSQVLLLRIVCVLLASIAVPVSYLIASRVLGNPHAALCATALVAALPLFTYTATHVANDGLAIGLGSVVVLFTLRRSVIWLAITLGVALLTKAYFLAFLPAIALLICFGPAKRAALALAGAMLISGWWYWGNWVTTGSLTGNLVLVQPSIGKMLAAASAFPLMRTVDFVWTGFLWMGNWSFLVARSWMYRVAAAGAILALFGVARLLWRRVVDIWILSAFGAAFALALLYFGLGSFAAGLGAGSHGWYACCVAAPIAVLALAGLRAALPIRVRPYSGPAAVLALSSLELFGLHFYQMPYYAGLISHTPQGGLPTARIAQFGDGGLRFMFERLALVAPGSLSVNALIAMWALSVLATMALIAASVYFGLAERRAAGGLFRI